MVMRFLVLYTVFFYIASLRSAHAYIDPGVGSYFLQIFLAGFLGGVFLMKDFLLGFVRRVVRRDSKRREGKDKGAKSE